MNIIFSSYFCFLFWFIFNTRPWDCLYDLLPVCIVTLRILFNWIIAMSLFWKFERNRTWLSFLFAGGVSSAPHLQIIIFCLGVQKNYTLNLDNLLIWAYPEMSKVRHGWVFVLILRVPPFFAKISRFCLELEKCLPSTLILYKSKKIFFQKIFWVSKIFWVIRIQIHSFYKNKVYKNVEPLICQKLKNILDAEIVIILQLFLIPHMEAENTFSTRKVTIFCIF